MATTVHAISLTKSVPNTPSEGKPAEGKKDKPLLFRMTEEYDKFTSFPLLPNKIINHVLGWVEELKLPDSWLTRIADTRHTIKGVNSAFGIPGYFTQHVKLFEACYQLKNRLTQEEPAKPKTIVEDVKKVFFAYLSSLNSVLKVPLALNKSKIIDLDKVSRLLPSALSKTESLLSLALSTMKLIDTSWTLRNQIKKAKLPLAEQIRHPSAKIKRTCLKLGTSSISIVSKCISAASLFLGWYTSPLVSMSLSAVSLIASVGSKIASNTHVFGLKKSKYSLEASVSLPA